MKLTPKQTRALEALEDSKTTELFFGGGAGSGKSALGCYWLMKCCLKYPGSRWLMGRSELKNLKQTTLVTFFDIARQQGLRAGIHYRLNHQDSTITFPNDSKIILADLYAYPSDPEFDSLGSLEITGAFLDEAPQATEKAKNILKSRIRFRLDEYGLIPKLLMCGNPAKNWVYYEFYKPWRQGVLKQDRQFIRALATDNPHISPFYIESLKGLDRNSRERLLYGNFEYSDDPTALIEYDAILNAFDNDGLPEGEKYITCDVARFGQDSTVIGLWNGWRVKLTQYRGKSLMQTADIIYHLQQVHQIPLQNIIVDETGLGGGVVDKLRCKGFISNARPLLNPVTHKEENYNNLKSQCYFRLAERINAGGLYIEPVDIQTKDFIIQELEQVREHNQDKDGKRQIMPKDKVKEVIGRSPDYSDTLMMREWFELRPKYTWLAR